MIVFNFYLRKIVLQEVGGKSFLSLREFIWNEWFIFIFIDIYNFFLLFLNFTNILSNERWQSWVNHSLSRVVVAAMATTTLDREWFTIIWLICQNLIIQHSIDWFSELPRYHRNLLFLTYKMDAVVRIADYRLVNILWLKIMHWIWRKGSAEVIKIIFSLGYITVFIYFW